MDNYIDDFGNPQHGRIQRWDYVNENPTTFWIHLKGWNNGDGEFGWYMWITAAVSLFSGFAFYIKAVNTSKFCAVFSYVQSVILYQTIAIFKTSIHTSILEFFERADMQA